MSVLQAILLMDYSTENPQNNPKRISTSFEAIFISQIAASQDETVCIIPGFVQKAKAKTFL